MNRASRLVISIAAQNLRVLRGHHCIRKFPVSTSARGEGFEIGSFRTPIGRFVIVEKIGDGESLGTIFKHRLPIGHWNPEDHSDDDDLILTRILRLNGLDPENFNTLERCIYIHGTNREDLIGIPASHGCIRLTNSDMLELFRLVAPGTAVEIVSAGLGDHSMTAYSSKI